MTRLEKSSGFKGTVVTATKGMTPREMVEDEKIVIDPHAWQSLANGKAYVANIRDALIAADPEGKATYVANAHKFLDGIAAMETKVKEAMPSSRQSGVRSSPPTMPSVISAPPTAWNSSHRKA